MIELANAPKRQPKDLEQQKADFTAEGAPPAGVKPASPIVHPQSVEDSQAGAGAAQPGGSNDLPGAPQARV